MQIEAFDPTRYRNGNVHVESAIQYMFLREQKIMIRFACISRKLCFLLCVKLLECVRAACAEVP